MVVWDFFGEPQVSHAGFHGVLSELQGPHALYPRWRRFVALWPCKSCRCFWGPTTSGREVLKWKKTWTQFWRKRGWLFDIYFFAIGGENAGLIEDAVILYYFQKNKTMDLFLTTTFGGGDLQSMMPWQISWNRLCGSVMSNVTLALVVRPATGPFFLGWKGRGFWEWPSHLVKRNFVVVEIKNWTESKSLLGSLIIILSFIFDSNSILKPLSLNTFPRIYDIQSHLDVSLRQPTEATLMLLQAGESHSVKPKEYGAQERRPWRNFQGSKAKISSNWKKKNHLLNQSGADFFPLQNHVILLMEEILYHLGCKKPVNYSTVINWCRMCGPSTVSLWLDAKESCNTVTLKK